MPNTFSDRQKSKLAPRARCSARRTFSSAVRCGNTAEKVLGIYNDRAHELLFDVGLSEYVNTVVAQLPYGRKRALEIATTLALDPEMLLLDEPTAGMAHDDVHRIVELIARVRQGRTILMVEHNLSVVEGLCDIITVLTRGKVLAEGDYATVSKNPDVIAAYLGSSDA